jgi:RES domain-containing protein
LSSTTEARITVWRVASERYADSLFSGEGAKQFGGPFNPPGFAVVYASATLSLALLELLVRVGTPARLGKLVAAEVTFAAASIARLADNDLPEDWQSSPPRSSTQKLGHQWIESGTSAVLKVPSVIVPQERNYLINLAHPEASHIQFGTIRPFHLDARLRPAVP